MNEEIRNFQIMVWTMDMIAEQAATKNEADELIKLAASYEPTHQVRTEEPIMSDTEYTITKDPETGLQVVRHNGRKIGQTQTPAGAALIRRNHRRQMERMNQLLSEMETQSDRDAWYDMDR